MPILLLIKRGHIYSDTSDTNLLNLNYKRNCLVNNNIHKLENRVSLNQIQAHIY